MMSNAFYVILLLLFVFLPDKTLNTSDKDEDLWRVAKKEFARRTREYLQNNPISDELRSFIADLKQSSRRKRQDYHNMYAIKDGMVVPLEELEESLNKQSDDLGENFTVVPLIIPIPLARKVTHKDSTASPLPQDNGFSDAWSSSNRPVLGRGHALMVAKQNKEAKEAQAKVDSDVKGSRNEQSFTDTSKDGPPMAESGNSRTEETVIDNLIDDKLKSTTEGPELNKVLEDVQNLINSQKKGKSANGALCNVSGYWDSNTGGVTFHIWKKDGEAQIQMKPREPPSEDGFIPLEKWNVTARIPFQQSAQVIVTLTANKGRRVALFLGECRICEGSETITGDWLIARTSSGCKDQKASHSFAADVFRKNNVETLREAHMKKISNMTTSATSTMNSMA